VPSLAYHFGARVHVGSFYSEDSALHTTAGFSKQPDCDIIISVVSGSCRRMEPWIGLDLLQTAAGRSKSPVQKSCSG